MKALNHLFEQNRAWAEKIKARQPDFFEKLSRQQSPDYFWIGCSDSRVPANEIVDLMPGELFVHRNVANVVVHSDLNCLSAMQFAVDVLKVRHVIVCGHYGCGGVHAALFGTKVGLCDNWLKHVQDVRQKHANLVMSIKDREKRCDRLCELNVIEQALSAAETTVIHDAWARGQEVTVHAWIYGLHDGLLRDLSFTVQGGDGIMPAYENAVARICEGKAHP